MRKGSITIVFLFLVGVLQGSLSFAHEEDSRVAIELDEPAAAQAGTISLNFQIIDLKNKIILKDTDLSVLHTKKLHLFLFDPALREFRHVHPEYSASKWQVTTDLAVNGNYWIWAQGSIAKDGEEFTSGTRLSVIGGSSPNPLPPELGDVRKGTDTTSQAVLSPNKIVAKKMAMLTLSISRTDGTKPNLTPYLGEMAHVIGVPEDGDSLIHVHPMNSGQPNQLMLHAEFPLAGQYRLWVQFNDDGIIRTIPLSVNVMAR